MKPAILKFILLMFFYNYAYAESNLCVAEAGASVVTQDNQNKVNTYILKTHSYKFIHTNENGSWVVKRVGENIPTFDKCTSKFFCENSQNYVGAFTLNKNGIFSITLIRSDQVNEYLDVVKGRCSKI